MLERDAVAQALDTLSYFDAVGIEARAEEFVTLVAAVCETDARILGRVAARPPMQLAALRREGGGARSDRPRSRHLRRGRRRPRRRAGRKLTGVAPAVPIAVDISRLLTGLRFARPTGVERMELGYAGGSAWRAAG